MATENLDLEKIELVDNMQTSLLKKMNGNFEKIDTAYKQLKDLLIAKTGKDNLSEAIDYVDELVNAQDGTITADKVFSGYVGYKGKERIVGTALATRSTGSASHLLTGTKLYDSSGNLIEGALLNKSGGNILSSGASISGDSYLLHIPTNAYYSTTSKIARKKADVLSDLGVKEIPTINVTCDMDTNTISSYGAGINKSGVLVIWAMTANTNYEHIYFYPQSIGIGTKGIGWDITAWDTSDPIACYACTVTGVGNYSTINVNLVYDTANSSYDYLKVNVTITGS